MFPDGDGDVAGFILLLFPVERVLASAPLDKC